jgi:ribosomal protein S18 acetylase RimI-like enzyme
MTQPCEKTPATAAVSARIIDIPRSEISRIAGLWELNRRHHEEITPCFKEKYRGKGFEERMAGLTDCPDEDLRISLVEEDGRAVGYCLSRIDGDQGELETLHVEAAARGKGYGKALIMRHIDWMKARGCRTIGVTVLADNVETVEVYKRLGFHPNTMYMELVEKG